MGKRRNKPIPQDDWHHIINELGEFSKRDEWEGEKIYDFDEPKQKFILFEIKDFLNSKYQEYQVWRDQVEFVELYIKSSQYWGREVATIINFVKRNYDLNALSGCFAPPGYWQQSDSKYIKINEISRIAEKRSYSHFQYTVRLLHDMNAQIIDMDDIPTVLKEVAISVLKEKLMEFETIQKLYSIPSIQRTDR